MLNTTLLNTTFLQIRLFVRVSIAALISLSMVSFAYAGGQREEPLSNSVKALMQKSISDRAAPRLIQIGRAHV